MVLSIYIYGGVSFVPWHDGVPHPGDLVGKIPGRAEQDRPQAEPSGTAPRRAKAHVGEPVETVLKWRGGRGGTFIKESHRSMGVSPLGVKTVSRRNKHQKSL